MADVKISQLPAATTPVDGTEVLPIVQSATTKQVSIANLTAGRAMSATSLTLTTPLAVTSGGTGLNTTGAGTFIVSGSANTISATATPTLGVQQTTQGTLTLANTAAGAYPVTLQSSNSTSAAWTFTLPTSGGSNGYILTTNGSGVSSWTNPTALGVDLDVGTTAITGGTVGRVLFEGTSNVLQESANLFWDISNSRLGIGTASPGARLDVLGPASVTSFTGSTRLGITVRGSTSATDYSGIDFIGNSQANPTARIAVITGGGGSSLYFGTSTNYSTGITNNALIIDPDGNVGIGGAPFAIGAGYNNLSLIATSGAAFFDTKTTSVTFRMQAVEATEGRLGTTTSHPVTFYTGGTERGRWNSGAPILCLSGGNTSATGTGIAFPATQSASSDVNTLDDYEEGTWTPVITAGTGAITSYTSSGSYTKVGRLVTLQFNYTITNNGTGGGFITITGIPVAIGGTANTGAGVIREIAVTGTMGSPYLLASTSMLAVTYNNGYPGGTNNQWLGSVFYYT
jgi:hypothetical protein